MRRTAALIAGGGPAGSAAAIVLARGGARPLLIERNREPQEIVCGGFIAGDTLGLLDRLGVDLDLHGAHAIGRVRLIAGRRIAECDLPFRAAGFSRRALDGILLNSASGAGAAIERGVTIRRIDPARRALELAEGVDLTGDSLFLATGKHEVRGAARPVPGRSDPALGLRIRLSPSAALSVVLDGMIELHLFRGGYAGLLLQEDGSVNLCLSVAQSRLKAAEGQPGRLIAALAEEAPILADRFGSARGAGPWASIARVPYGWRSQETTPGIFRLGDQAAVIASLAGDGIAIALASGALAAQRCLAGGADGAQAFQTDFATHARRSVGVAQMLKIGGEIPWIAGPLVGMLRHAPGLVRRVAALTRIGET